MNRRFRLGIGMACAGLVLALTSPGCDYSSDTPSSLAHEPSGSDADLLDTEASRKAVILKNVVNLIKTAALKPGGRNFELATTNLNQYFGRVSPADCRLDDAARGYLLRQFSMMDPNPEPMVQSLEAPEFGMTDARHLEDCMLYYKIAARAAGTGDDLTRVRRVFDWMVREVQLVPSNSLGSPRLGQVRARPYDVLIRGMATEDGGIWRERSWLFIALCRQLGIDAGLLTYSPTGPPRANLPLLDPSQAKAKERYVIWICAALIDGKAYLFDARIGLPVPRADGLGVATLDDALSDARVLDQLDLPGTSPYEHSRGALLRSPTKIGVLLDSSPGYLSTRMKRLQRDLQGSDRTVLYRDPADQAKKFAEALGPRFGKADLWEMPLSVYTLLFSSGEFTEATRQSLRLFDPSLPLVYARVKQLRGDLTEAVQEYVAFRFAENPTLTDKKTKMPPPLQGAMDIHSTYFLGLCHLEQNNPKQAEFFFKETIRLLPPPGRGLPYFCMFRWGAETNLARLYEAQGDAGRAVAHYSESNPTAQQHGNLVRARALVWSDPMGVK